MKLVCGFEKNEQCVFFCKYRIGVDIQQIPILNNYSRINVNIAGVVFINVG